jgi:hypothetical protein
MNPAVHLGKPIRELVLDMRFHSVNWYLLTLS